MNPNEQQSQQPQVEPAENFQYVPPQKQGVPKRVLIIGVILLILLLVLGMLVLSTNRRRSQETNVSPTPTKNLQQATNRIDSHRLKKRLLATQLRLRLRKMKKCWKRSRKVIELFIP